MGSDGAELGVTANDALQTIIGGAPVPEERIAHTPEEMKEYLLSAPSIDDITKMSDDHGYTEVARYVGKIFYEFFTEHPEVADMPNDEKFELDESIKDWEERWRARKVIVEGVDPAFKRLDPARYDLVNSLGISGFQFGWGLNAAKYAFNKPVGRNPALMTIG